MEFKVGEVVRFKDLIDLTKDGTIEKSKRILGKDNIRLPNGALYELAELKKVAEVSVRIIEVGRGVYKGLVVGTGAKLVFPEVFILGRSMSLVKFEKVESTNEATKARRRKIHNDRVAKAAGKVKKK